MIAHIMISEKFMPPFISLMEQEFSRYNHQYLFITSEKYEFGLMPSSTIRFFHTANDFKLVADILIKADKIILHGLWREKINLLLLANPALLKKSYWVMWGGDFYFPERHSKVHHNVIKKVGFLVTGTTGEIDLVRKWYGAEGEHVNSYVYTSNIVDDELLYRSPSNSNAGMHILAGNSAAQTNNHLFIFEQLRPHKDRIAKLIVPLSYADSGDKKYVAQVIYQGNKFFGESFTPLTHFLKLDEYNALLATIDIAIFAHNRQQGMGNIIHLLGLGIKVFMRSDITIWHLFEELNIKVYDVNKFDLMPIDLITAKRNNESVKKHFSQATLIGQLKKVFN